jgi:hypothetical protein
MEASVTLVRRQVLPFQLQLRRDLSWNARSIASTTSPDSARKNE